MDRPDDNCSGTLRIPVEMVWEQRPEIDRIEIRNIFLVVVADDKHHGVVPAGTKKLGQEAKRVVRAPNLIECLEDTP